MKSKPLTEQPTYGVVPKKEYADADPESGYPVGDVYLIAIPGPVIQELSKLAARKNLNLAQLIGQAFDEYIDKHFGP